MARLQTFLPEIENANKQLSEQLSIDPKQVDIENVDEDGQFIEMVCILVWRTVLSFSLLIVGFLRCRT